MADWTDFDLNVFLPGEPLTSAKALAWYENPIAIAEGAVDAPRVLGRALDLFLFEGTLSSAGVAITDLDRFEAVRIVGSGGASTQRTLQARYSDDNGANWGSFQNILTPGAIAFGTGVARSFIYEATVNLQTGRFYGVSLASGGTPIDAEALGVNASGTHTVPSNANAVEFRFDSAVSTRFAAFAQGTFG